MRALKDTVTKFSLFAKFYDNDNDDSLKPIMTMIGEGRPKAHSLIKWIKRGKTPLCSKGTTLKWKNHVKPPRIQKSKMGANYRDDRPMTPAEYLLNKA